MRVDEAVLDKAAARCRERGIRIPTFAQMRDPQSLPESIRSALATVGMQDVDPLNLFRITWKNEPLETGGGFNDGNWIEFPPELTRVEARIIGLVGKWFPTGAHKVGAGFGCLVPRLVTGQFDPATHKAVWPSTGNFCRGGTFDCALLGCDSVAILPEEMSRERFDWLRALGAEVIATPGCESNVKEIYDKCWEIRRTRPECVVFNQFEEFGNAIWHHSVTGATIEDLFRRVGAGKRLAAFVSATGSAGTLAAGDFLRTVHPHVRITAVEALQCPTLLECGFGGHRIEGIGDKHVPWIHNVRNTDLVSAVDDERCIGLMRLFNEPEGQCWLAGEGIAEDFIMTQLPLLGISSICNLVASIKTARLYDMDRNDVIFTVLTDSMELYGSRLAEQREHRGKYSAALAERTFGRHVEAITTDHLRELTYTERKRLHNFKYFTWVEQQQRSVEDLQRLWDPDFWAQTYQQVEEWDRLIESFNSRVALP
jgi:cysteine synthase